MIRIEQILCPADFSETSQRALDYAAAIARWYEARLTVLYVSVYRATMDLPPLVLTDADRAGLMADMRKIAGRVPPQVPVELRIQEAENAGAEILAQLTATQADLLIMGTHGRSGFERLFLGSVTERVMRKATCPTLVVPPGADDLTVGTQVQFRRLLCAVDFSEGSLNALAMAISMAEEADAHLTLLNVLELRPEFLGGQMPASEVDRIRASAEAGVLRRLRDLIPEQARSYCTVGTAVVEGSAYREVLRYAKEAKTDLIVMGAQGRGAIDRLIFGSTTDQVTRAATCPVLIVRKP